MPITIPTSVSQAYDDLIKRGLSTDEYSYLVFDVKKTETDPSKKVQVFMKVYVPENKRRIATANVIKAMRSEGYEIEQRQSKGSSIPEIDIQVSQSNNKTQVIRVQFKPSQSAGSGGGSDQTKIQESTSCLYNALRFHVFNKNLTPDMTLTTDHMEEASKFIDTPDATLDEMIDFSNSDPYWKGVFMDGANKLYDKVQAGSSSDYIFVRGDKAIDDGVVKKAFNQCKASLIHKELKNEDKWNPSDIWMVSKGARDKVIDTLKPYGVKKTSTTIEVLNAELVKLFTSGKLMGVSLKKTGASGTVKVMNNETPEQRRKNLGVGFKKDLSINGLVYDSKRNFTGAQAHKRYPMDVYIKYGTGDKDEIQLRNFGGDNKGDWKLELKGQYAAMGKIQGNVARFILKNTGFKDIPQEPKWDDCHPKKSQTKSGQDITKEIYNLLKKYSAQGLDLDDEEGMMGDIEIKRQSWRYSKLSGLRFLDYLCKKNVDADKAVKELYLFGGSASDHSSIYYKYS